MKQTLEASGRAIWDSLKADTLPPVHQALVLEYARAADTADRLAGLAAGRRESWAELVYDEMGEVHLAVDKLLGEQRNTQTVLKAIHAELRAAGLFAASSLPVPANTPEETPLERRRREKVERERQLG